MPARLPREISRPAKTTAGSRDDALPEFRYQKGQRRHPEAPRGFSSGAEGSPNKANPRKCTSREASVRQAIVGRLFQNGTSFPITFGTGESSSLPSPRR